MSKSLLFIQKNKLFITFCSFLLLIIILGSSRVAPCPEVCPGYYGYWENEEIIVFSNMHIYKKTKEVAACGAPIVKYVGNVPGMLDPDFDGFGTVQNVYDNGRFVVVFKRCGE